MLRKRIVSLVLAATMMITIIPTQAFASNILTNVMGYAEYLAAGGAKPMTTNEVYAIEATVVVCKNPDGKFDHEQKLSSQGDVVGTVAYWPGEDIRSAIQRGEIISTQTSLYNRRELLQRIPTNSLKSTYSWIGSRDRLNIGIPNPGTAGVEAFRSWTETPENCLMVVQQALCEKNNSAADESSLAMWTSFYDSCKANYTEIPDLALNSFVPTVEDGKLVSKVEFSVVWSVKILYEKDDANGNKERYFVDTNQIAQIDEEFTVDGGSAAEQQQWYVVSKVAYNTMAEIIGNMQLKIDLSADKLGLANNDDYELIQKISSGEVHWNNVEVNRIMQENAAQICSIVEGTGSYAGMTSKGREAAIQECHEDCVQFGQYWQNLIENPEEIVTANSRPLFRGAAGTYAYATHPQMSFLESDLFANEAGIDYDGGYTASNGTFVNFVSTASMVSRAGWSISTLTTDPEKGIVIYAVDADTGEEIEGLTVKITTPDGTEEEKTGEDGPIKFPDVPPGEITVEEIEPPDGYEPGDNKEKVTVTPDGKVEIEWEFVQNDPTTITIKKVNEDGAPVSGASFSISSLSFPSAILGTPGTMTIHMSSSTYTLSNLDAGEYKITETSAPDGYLKDNGTYTVILEKGDEYELTVVNVKEQPGNAEFLIEENELTRAFHTDPDFKSNMDPGPSYENKGHGSHGRRDNRRPCKRFIEFTGWEDDTLVPVETFFGPRTFNYVNSGMSLYRIIRNSSLSNVLLKYNVMNDFRLPESRYYDSYGNLTRVDWVSHRTGINSSKSGELQLAEYMNDTAENEAYIEFSESTYGTPRSAYENPNGNPYYGEFIEKLYVGGQVSRVWEYIKCQKHGGGGGGSKIAYAYTPTATSDLSVGARKTYVASAHSVGPDESGRGIIQPEMDNNRAPGTILFGRRPSRTLTFYPTYKMQYTDEINSASDKDTWMLAFGERSFTSNDAFKIYASDHDTNDKGFSTIERTWWSRDRQDAERYDETGLPTVKAGYLHRVYDEGFDITLQYFFHFQDPKYKPGVEAENAETLNESVKPFVNQITQKLFNTAKSNAGGTYGFYSNLWDASSENAPAALKRAPTESWAESEDERNILTTKDGITVRQNTYLEYYVIDSDTGNTFDGMHTRTINIGGETFTRAGRWSDSYSNINGNTLINSSAKLKSLLETDKGRGGWYNEQYEGLCVGVVTRVFHVEGLASEYAGIHWQLSDDKTEVNELGKKMTYPDSVKIIKDKWFATGVFADLGPVRWADYKGEDIVSPWQSDRYRYIVFNAQKFHVRSSLHEDDYLVTIFEGVDY